MKAEELYSKMLDYAASILITFCNSHISIDQLRDWVRDSYDMDCHKEDSEFPVSEFGFTLEDVMENLEEIVRLHNLSADDNCAHDALSMCTPPKCKGMNIQELYHRLAFYQPAIEGFVQNLPVKGSDIIQWVSDTRSNYSQEEWPDLNFRQVIENAHLLAEYHNLGLTSTE